MRIWFAVSPRPTPIASRQKSKARAQRVNTRIVCGAYLADIVIDSHTFPPICHWIVQRVGSPEILHCGQELSFEEAEAAAETYLKQLAGRERKKKTGN
jgi:hypothetical protein